MYNGHVGHKGQLAPRCRALDAMIQKYDHGIQKAVHLFRFRNFEHLIGSGWSHNLRPGCRRHLARTFHTPARSLRWHTCIFPPESAVPITAKVWIKFLCPHSRCFGSYFDVIFLMYLVSSGFSFKPTSSSSSTQFSQEWVCRKIVDYGFGWIVLKVIFKGRKGQILLIFHFEAIFSKTVC